MAADLSCEEQPDLKMAAQHRKPLYFCDICKIAFVEILHLSNHLVGTRHRNAMGERSPEHLANLQRLQYFIDTFMKEEPMIGLEYVIERYNAKAKCMYTYKCLLCNVEGTRGSTVLHLCGARHRSAYLEKYHLDLVVKRHQFFIRAQYTQMLKAAALQVDRIHGRKRIHEVTDEQHREKAGPVSAKIPKMPSTIGGWHVPPNEENAFPAEHMVVLDETGEDLPNDNAASPASCDSSDSDSASVDFSRSHMLILDETNDDNDHPDSPASCDLSASESAPSSSGAEAAHDISEKSSSKKHSAKSDQTSKESEKTFHIEPVKNNQDVFQFLKTFAIGNQSDVDFLEKVKEIFARALRNYAEKKMEELLCTEEEHSSPEESTEGADGPRNHEARSSSTLQAINKNECEKINLAPSSPDNSSPTQCIINLTSTADDQQDSSTINQSYSPYTSSVASGLPANTCEDTCTSIQLPVADSGNDNEHTATEADPLMESEDYATATCSDDDDLYNMYVFRKS